MKEQIKIALLAVIAGTLIIQTVLLSNNDDYNDSYFSEGESTLSNSPTLTTPTAIANVTPNISTEPAKPEPPKTSMIFAEESFEFGNIKQDSENKHIFKFTNTGDKPLIIENAKGSCGCTVPVWPKEPIPPGGTGEIEVVYKPGKQKGNQRKTVTVTANTEPKDTRIVISAFVEEVSDDAN